MTDDRADAPNEDWAARATGLVETLVEAIRDRSLRPVLRIVRFAIVGVIGVLIGLVAAVALVIGLVRLFDQDVFNNRVWATDLLVGGIFVALGLFFFSLGRRARRRKNDE